MNDTLVQPVKTERVQRASLRFMLFIQVMRSLAT